jgi:ribonuclease D
VTGGAGTLITNQAELDRVIEAARLERRIGLDTEFMRERTYAPRLCLVQVAIGQDVSLVDPLADVDLAGIAELVADPEIETVLHAAKQDLEIFYLGFGSKPVNIFDVQLAAGFAGLGASLPYGRVVEETTGTRLEKGESYTDWCRRPLTEAQMRYARDDVRYLTQMADDLLIRLREQGREDWAREEMRVALEDEKAYVGDPDEAWRRVSGRGSLSGRQLTVLVELARWREQTAAQRDIPRGWVLKDVALVEIARRRPRTKGQLKAIRGINERDADRMSSELIAAIERGLDAPQVAQRPPPPRAAQAQARMLSGLADALVRARSQHAGIAPELVATRGELEAVVLDLVTTGVDDSGHRLLRGWRRELAGQAVLDLAQGRIAVRAISRPPYVEEVPLGV